MARGLGAHVRQPEVTQGAAVVVVPLGEGDGEVTRLPAARTHVPRLGDQLRVGQDLVRRHRDEERVHGAEARRETAERGRQVEAETIHAHLADPVAQRIQHHLNGLRMVHVDGVARARHVDRLDRARGGVTVVHVGVETAPGQGRTGVAALTRVVVDNVENDLDARLVQERDHAAELVDDRLGAALARGLGGVGGLGGEEREGRVPPVVRQASFGEEGLVALRVDGQQLDGGDAQVLQVGHGGRVSQARVGAAQLRGHTGHVLREALDVDLVDDGGLPRRVGLRRDREGGLYDDRARHIRRGVDGGAAQRVLGGVEVLIHAVRVDRRLHVHHAVEASAVGVEEKLVRVIELAAVRIPGAVHAETVAGARTVSGDVTMPDAGLRAEQSEAGLSSGLVEDAHVHAGGGPGDHGDIEPIARRENPQTGGNRVRFGDAHDGDAGRAGTLGHKRVPLSHESVTAP